MLLSKLVRIILLILSCIQLPVLARDVLLEFKAAYFRASSSRFRDIYGHGSALFGPEVTFQLTSNEHWYGFASVDYLTKKGQSIGFCSPTKVSLLPLGLGIKYCEPFCWGDVYVGLGIQPVRLKTIDCSPFVKRNNSHWTCGGIAKIGSYIDLPGNFFADIFIDYSFAHIGCHGQCQTACRYVVPLKANVSGAIFGGGIGYRFN